MSTLARSGSHDEDGCPACGRSRRGAMLLEHAMSAGRALVVGGGILASTFLLTAAMQPTYGVATSSTNFTSCRPIAEIEVPPLDAPAPPPPPVIRQVLLPRGGAVGSSLLAAERPSLPEGSARVTGTARLLGRADAAYRSGNFWVALRRYLAVVKQDPRRVDGHFGVALARFELYDDAGSRRALHRALKLRPEHALSHLLLAYLEQLDGHADVARLHYGEYLRLDPGGSFAPEVKSLLEQL